MIAQVGAVFASDVGASRATAATPVGLADPRQGEAGRRGAAAWGTAGSAQWAARTASRTCSASSGAVPVLAHEQEPDLGTPAVRYGTAYDQAVPDARDGADERVDRLERDVHPPGDDHVVGAPGQAQQPVLEHTAVGRAEPASVGLDATKPSPSGAPVGRGDR